MSLFRFKWVSEHLQTSVSVGGAERSSGASATPTCVGGRSPDPKPASYTHTHTHARTHACTHANHTNPCTKTKRVFMHEHIKGRKTHTHAHRLRADVEVYHWDPEAKEMDKTNLTLSSTSFVLFISRIAFDLKRSPFYLAYSFFSVFSLFLTFSPFSPAFFPYLCLLFPLLALHYIVFLNISPAVFLPPCLS